jgi:hypothetical protein
LKRLTGKGARDQCHIISSEKMLIFSEEIMRQAGLRHGKIAIAILQVTKTLFPQEESLKNVT